MGVDPGNGIRARLEDLARRVGDLEREANERDSGIRTRFHKHDAEISAVVLLCNQFPDILRRLQNIEAVKVDVLDNRVSNQERRVDGLVKVGLSVAVALVVAAATFALTVASGAIG